MNRKSSQTITYHDLQAWAKKQIGYARQRKEAAVGRGVTNQDALSHDLACAEKVSRMLGQCEPGRQADFFTLFEETR